MNHLRNWATSICTPYCHHQYQRHGSIVRWWGHLPRTAQKREDVFGMSRATTLQVHINNNWSRMRVCPIIQFRFTIACIWRPSNIPFTHSTIYRNCFWPDMVDDAWNWISLSYCPIFTPASERSVFAFINMWEGQCISVYLHAPDTTGSYHFHLWLPLNWLLNISMPKHNVCRSSPHVLVSLCQRSRMVRPDY